MRNFYQHPDDPEQKIDYSNIVVEVIISADGKSGTYRQTPKSDAQALVDSGLAVIYDTQDILNEAIQYTEDRRNVYPDVEEQLDLLFHEMTASGSLTTSGSWYKTIKSIKDTNPKP